MSFMTFRGLFSHHRIRTGLATGRVISDTACHGPCWALMFYEKFLLLVGSIVTHHGSSQTMEVLLKNSLHMLHMLLHTDRVNGMSENPSQQNRKSQSQPLRRLTRGALEAAAFPACPTFVTLDDILLNTSMVSPHYMWNLNQSSSELWLAEVTQGQGWREGWGVAGRRIWSLISQDVLYDPARWL